MAKKDSGKDSRKRKQQKHRKRREKEEKYEQWSRRLQQVPDVRYEGMADANPRLVKAVQNKMRYMLAHRKQLLLPIVCKSLEVARQDGWQQAVQTFRRHYEHEPDISFALVECLFFNMLGIELYEHLPENLLQAMTPYHDIDVKYRDIREPWINVKFNTLRRVRLKATDATGWQSPSKPTIKVRGIPMEVVYTRHAVDRLTERLVVDPLSFGGVGGLHVVIRQSYQWDKDGFSIWYGRKSLYNQVDGILGDNADRTKPHLCRIGYAKCAIEEPRRIVVKTVLTPGMENTPECAWYLNNVSGDRSRLRQEAAKLTAKALDESQDFSLLRRFHYEGNIPQVVETNSRHNLRSMSG
jgi:hypothetical protein